MWDGCLGMADNESSGAAHIEPRGSRKDRERERGTDLNLRRPDRC